MAYRSEAPVAAIDTLRGAVTRYFDLMHDSDILRFDQVFRSTAQLHGMRNGEMRVLTAEA